MAANDKTLGETIDWQELAGKLQGLFNHAYERHNSYNASTEQRTQHTRNCALLAEALVKVSAEERAVRAENASKHLVLGKK